MVDWSNAKTPPKGAQKDIIRFKPEDLQNRIRLVGPVMPRYVYWFNNNEGKRFPVECLSFNRETEEFVAGKNIDPVMEIAEELRLANKIKPDFAYVCNVIDRKDGKVKLYDVKLTVYKQLVDLARDKEYGSPSDPITGYDIIIRKEKTGPLTKAA